MTREKGVVKWFSTEKGYGFIRRDNGEEVFVHHTDIDVEGYASLRNGETVEFEIFESDRGARAHKLVSLEEGNGSGESRGSSRPASSPEGQEGGEGRKEARTRSQRARKAVGAVGPLAEQLREKLGGRFPGFGR